MDTRAPEPINQPWRTTRYVARDGIGLVGDIGGNPSAPTIALLHGGGQTRHSWSATMQALIEAGYNVINYDARGHGDSDWSADGVYTFPLRAEDLRVVLENVQGPIALVGASMGGITSLQALGDGARPVAIVLVDIVLRPERRGVERVRDFMAGNPEGFASLDEAIDAVAAYNPNRPRPTDPSGLMRNLRRRPDGRLRWHWDPRMVPKDLDADLAAMASIIDRLPTLSATPVLLIRGSNSDVLSDTSVADFRRHLQNTEVLDVAGAGHMVAGDSNEAFQRGVIDFLRRHLDPAARRDIP
jgi:pimeloyl-ACP methyl ester carboxylesterase